jgi:acetyltransferase-like isoleucine patch superfamily enzyme
MSGIIADKTARVETSLISSALRRPGHSLGMAWRLLLSRWKLRSCTKVGHWGRVYGRLIVDNAGEIRIGERFRVRATHVPVELASLPGGVLTIGDGVYINSGVSICAARSITIGNHCAIGNYTLIMDTDFHAVDDHMRSPEPQPVLIGENAWLGARVTVLKGVTIGRGAVVAAGAVVTRDVPAHTLVGGVPARIIRVLPASEISQDD